MKGYQEKYPVDRQKRASEECMSSKQQKINVDVSDFLLSHNVRTKTELFDQASRQMEAGKKGRGNFVMSRSSKTLQDVISNIWKMNNAMEDHRLQTDSDGNGLPGYKWYCVEGCCDSW